MKKEELKEAAKDIINLDKPVLSQRLTGKLKPYAKIIYLVLLVVLVLNALRALVMLFAGHISIALFDLIFTAVYFVILRLFAEALVQAPDAAPASKTETK